MYFVLKLIVVDVLMRSINKKKDGTKKILCYHVNINIKSEALNFDNLLEKLVVIAMDKYLGIITN